MVIQYYDTTPPTNSITTEVQVFDVKNIKEIIEFEVYRGDKFILFIIVKRLAGVRGGIAKALPRYHHKISTRTIGGDQLEEIMSAIYQW